MTCLFYLSRMAEAVYSCYYVLNVLLCIPFTLSGSCFIVFKLFKDPLKEELLQDGYKLAVKSDAHTFDFNLHTKSKLLNGHVYM